MSGDHQNMDYVCRCNAFTGICDECRKRSNDLAEIPTLRAKLAEAERERDEARAVAEGSEMAFAKIVDDIERLRGEQKRSRRNLDAMHGALVKMRTDRDALAAKLSEARSLCYRASRSDMLPAEILGELAGIVGDGNDG